MPTLRKSEPGRRAVLRGLRKPPCFDVSFMRWPDRPRKALLRRLRRAARICS